MPTTAEPDPDTAGRAAGARWVRFTTGGEPAAFRLATVLGFRPAGGTARGRTVLDLSTPVGMVVVDQDPAEVARRLDVAEGTPDGGG